MQYQVPQFIEFEDKIFGPLTLKQFIYIAGGAAISFFAYALLPFFLGLVVIILVGGFCLALAFYKPDGHRPFIVMLEHALKYYSNSKLYIWKRIEKKPVAAVKKEEEKVTTNLNIPKLSDSKLKELTWSLDIQKNIGEKK